MSIKVFVAVKMIVSIEIFHNVSCSAFLPINFFDQRSEAALSTIAFRTFMM